MNGERSTADWYRAFGELEARGESEVYEDWALGVAGDARVVALIDSLPLQKRQPNLVFAAARLCGAPDEPGAAGSGYARFRSWLLEHWPQVAEEALRRRTQTNEPRRCAALLPALGLIPGPLALIELGASAGLCLQPDRYSYRYGRGGWLHPDAGPSAVALETDAEGPIPVPARLPEVAWRAGVDLDPLDVRDPDAVRWLTTLVWPGQAERRECILAAVGLAAQDPPPIARGEAIEELPELLANVPRGASTVIVTSAMLVYQPYAERMRLVAAIRASGARWVSLDGVGVLPEVDALLAEPVRGRFTLSLDGEPLAEVGPHGQSVHWFAVRQRPS